LIHASVNNHYDSDGSGSLHAAVESNSSHLKILDVGDRKINAGIEIEIFFSI
jgi:hypothetical protein